MSILVLVQGCAGLLSSRAEPQIEATWRDGQQEPLHPSASKKYAFLWCWESMQCSVCPHKLNIFFPIVEDPATRALDL